MFIEENLSKHGFNYISDEYNRGYREAIQDIIEEIKPISLDLKYHNKRLTEKTILEFLKCFLRNRKKLQEHAGYFIRYNTQIQNFECVITEQSRVY